MKCPNCGEEMKEGQLICEACGNEIQIVPDFEPEIENSITETLSTLVALDEEAKEAGKPEDDAPKTEEIKEPDAGETKKAADEEEERNLKSRRIGAVMTVVTVVLVALCSYLLYFHHIHTAEYQIEKAIEYAGREEYEQAIAYLDAAYRTDDTQAQPLFLKADYYYLMQDNEAALQALKLVIDKDIYPYEDIEDAYDKMIAIYAKEARYEEINDLLLACKEDSIVNIFQGYMAKEPDFNYVEGDYAEVIPLKLSSNTSGNIYYTTDGSTPTKASSVYTAPLFLESGEHHISAFFVNDYGIESEIVSKTYHINLEVPNAPEVVLYSGEYMEPTMISVNGQEGCSIYYTTDESQPTKDSVPYTGPIPMPLGTTNFKFVNISEAGVSSDVTMRTYTLRLDGTISTRAAVDTLVKRLVETGYLLDTAGKTALLSGSYSYQFSSVLQIEGEAYFTINEYYDGGTGVLSRTDKVFLVQAYTGATARLGYNEKGEFAAVPV
ncbi:MAG: chitobiase/beta-hexosaminidase C-terminal domain-containing protein [Clostridium sp.]|nr:chitobiase/beta-hexosaminidase C-terminal domain-containing protein [Clostridium sp.]